MRGGRRKGAGRPAVRRLTTALHSLDVRELRRAGRLVANMRESVEYVYGGSKVHAVIATQATGCRFGGERVWFVCQACGRRVSKLYLGAGLGCRRCLGLAYPSQRKNAVRRGWDKQRKIEARLAPDGEWNGWQKPKGMHWRTFSNLVREIRTLERARDAALLIETVRSGLV